LEPKTNITPRHDIYNNVINYVSSLMIKSMLVSFGLLIYDIYQSVTHCIDYLFTCNGDSIESCFVEMLHSPMYDVEPHNDYSTVLHMISCALMIIH